MIPGRQQVHVAAAQSLRREAKTEPSRPGSSSAHDSASSRDLSAACESQIESAHLMAMRMQIQNQPNQALAQKQVCCTGMGQFDMLSCLHR
jgi:hypothetical protein